MLGGLWGWVVYAAAMFAVGVNDSAQEVLSLTIAFATTLPACLLALWRRLIAGLWLTFAACYFPYALVAQRTYMIQVRHFPDQPTVLQTAEGCLPYSIVLIGLGLFAVITELLKWPRLIGNRD